MGRRLKLAIAGVTVVLVAAGIFVGTALAQPPTPNTPPPTDKAELTEWMRTMMESVHGEGSFDEMTQWMDQMHGPGSFDQMLDAMSQGGHCGGSVGDGQTGGPGAGGFGGMMGGRGGMMGGRGGMMGTY